MNHIVQDLSSYKEIPVSSESIYDGKILHVERWQVRCANDRLAVREVVLHKGAAAVVPVFPDGTTLLVRQHRVAIDQITYEIPAGKLDRAEEDPLECAIRELHEETGLQADSMTHLTTIFTTPGFCTEKIAIYLARGLHEGHTQTDEDEFLSLIRMPLSEAVRRVMQGEFTDAKTVCGLMMAQQYLLGEQA